MHLGFFVDHAAEEDEQSSFLTAIGLQRATTDKLRHIGPWLPPNDFEVALKELSRDVRDTSWAETFTEISDADLAYERDLTKKLGEIFGGFMTMARPTFGKDAFGFEEISIALTECESARDLIYVFMCLHILFSCGYKQLAEDWVHKTYETVEHVRDFSKLQFVASRVPAVAEIWSPKKYARALRSESAYAALCGAMRAVGQQSRKEVDAAIEEWRSLIRS